MQEVKAAILRRRWETSWAKLGIPRSVLLQLGVVLRLLVLDLALKGASCVLFQRVHVPRALDVMMDDADIDQAPLRFHVLKQFAHRGHLELQFVGGHTFERKGVKCDEPHSYDAISQTLS